jgi:hypothetical protein
MSPEMEALIVMLKANPGMVYITPSGRTIYMLVGPEEKLMYLHSLNTPFSEMSDEEINLAIQKMLS